MAIASTRDLDAAKTAITEWLSTRLQNPTVTLGALSVPDGVGFSNETLFFDAHWQEEGTPHSARYVLRVEPSTHTLFYEAKERYPLQIRLLGVLAGQDAVPTPTVCWVEDSDRWLGSPFYIMEHIEGSTQPDVPAYNQAGWLREADPDRQRELWWSTLDAVIAIHKLDWRALGLDFLLEPERGSPGIEQQLRYHEEFYEWAREGERYRVVEEIHDWLVRHRPFREPLALCWGDARLGNVIYKNFRPNAVIDWDMVAIGNPLQDLAWWMFLDRVMVGDHHTGDPENATELPGFPSRAETLLRWQRETGYSADNIHYYEVFAAYRFTICSLRYPTLMKAAGFPPEAGAFATNLRERAELAFREIVATESTIKHVLRN